MQDNKLNLKTIKMLSVLSIIILGSFFIITTKSEYWTHSKRISFLEMHSAYPTLAFNNSTLYLAWHTDFGESSNKTISEIYFTKSIDNGKTWATPTRVTYSNSYSTYPKLAVENNTIHLVWVDDRDGNEEIYYKKSINGGKTWSNDTRLTYARGSSIRPSITVYHKNVHIVWMDYRFFGSEIYYKVSRDNGDNWSNDTRLTYDDTPSYRPSIATNGKNIYVVWQDHRSGSKFEIYYKISKDGGLTWEKTTRLTYAQVEAEWPVVAAYDKNVHVAWVDKRDGNPEIYYKRSTDEGLTWSKDVRLTSNNNISTNLFITVNRNTVYVVWADDRNGNFEVYYKISRDNGKTWSDDIRLTFNKGASHHPCLVVSNIDGKLHFVWDDNRDNKNKCEIYYKQINNTPPLITNISISKKENKIYVYGFDMEDNKSDLICNIYYILPNGSKTMLKAKFKSSHWEAPLNNFQNLFPITYTIEAELIDSQGIYNRNFTSVRRNRNVTPSFQLLLFLLSIILIIIFKKYNKASFD